MRKVVGCDGLVQDHQTITFLGLKKPLYPPPTIPPKLEQELPFVATMCEVPYLTGNVVSLRSCHCPNLYIALLRPKNIDIAMFFRRLFDNLNIITLVVAQPDPRALERQTTWMFWKNASLLRSKMASNCPTRLMR